MYQIRCQYWENPHWEPGASIPVDFESQIRIHKIYIPENLNQIPNYFELLSIEEKIRANKYIQLKDSQRFIIARGILKQLASQYLHIPASEITICIGPNKKPYIRSSSIKPLDYNISHSGNWIIIAFGLGNFGIDIEQIQTTFNYESLLPVCFSQIEQDYITNHSISRELFYRLWTRKESMVKATARGLDDNLPLLTCLDGEWELFDQFSNGQNWHVGTFPLDADHLSSISFTEGNKNILFIEQDISI